MENKSKYSLVSVFGDIVLMEICFATVGFTVEYYLPSAISDNVEGPFSQEGKSQTHGGRVRDLQHIFDFCQQECGHLIAANVIIINF